MPDSGQQCGLRCIFDVSVPDPLRRHGVDSPGIELETPRSPLGPSEVLVHGHFMLWKCSHGVNLEWIPVILKHRSPLTRRSRASRHMPVARCWEAAALAILSQPSQASSVRSNASRTPGGAKLTGALTPLHGDQPSRVPDVEFFGCFLDRRVDICRLDRADPFRGRVPGQIDVPICQRRGRW